jgi:hypothetical protein
MRLDNAALDVRFIGSNSFGLFVLRHDFEFGAQAVLIDNLNLHHLCMLEEALAVVDQIGRIYTHFRNNAVRPDRDGQHVLPDALKVYYEYVVVVLLHAGRKIDHDFGGLIGFESAAFIFNVELVLQSPTITGHSNDVVNVYFRGIGQVDGAPLGKLVGYFTEVYDILREAERGSHHVTFESQRKHL